jgi:hypothetical protein
VSRVTEQELLDALAERDTPTWADVLAMHFALGAVKRRRGDIAGNAASGSYPDGSLRTKRSDDDDR